MYFLPIRKFSREKVVYIMIAALLVGLTPIPQSLFAAYGEMDVNRTGISTYADETDFRWAYLAESVFFLFVILLNYNKIKNTPKDIVLLNMALVFCTILLIFVKSENGGRLGWLYMMGTLCTISNICIQNKRIQKEGLMLIIVSFLLFIRIYYSWQTGLQLYPYKTFLTDGVRENDPVYEKFEYDENYKSNKFYRPAFRIFEE